VEDEIDLRVYINVLIRFWRLIAGLTVGAAVVVFVVTLFLPPSYQATAMIVITRPLYQLQFSPQIQNLDNANAQQLLTGKAALDLATSDSLLQQVIDAIGNDLAPKERTLTAIRAIVKAKTGNDPSIINLTVNTRDPQQTARIANAWADLYVREINDLYGQSGEQLKFFETQLEQAQRDLDKADQALVDFEKRNDAAVLQAQLTAKQGAFANYLSLNESLKLLLQNVRDLQDQLSRQPAGAQSTLGDDLSALLLQVNALNNAQSNIPIQLQLPGASSLSNKTVGQQAAYMADLARTIETKQTEAKQQAELLPAEIKALQGQIQEARTEEARLTRQRDLAQTVYTTLAQKVGETRITAQDTSGRVRLASAATVPDRPAGAKRLTTTALAAALGLLAGVMAAFAIEYFKQPLAGQPH
jgi:succinoglycan biosynthesis transport protein ExoP